MDPMKELIDEATVERLMLLVAVAGPLAGLVGGAVWAVAKRAARLPALLRGLSLGLLGPLIFLMWRVFSYLVRYEPAPDPKDDYFGLERVDVLLANIVLFAAVGAAVGWIIRLVRERDRRHQASEVDPEAEVG